MIVVSSQETRASRMVHGTPHVPEQTMQLLAAPTYYGSISVGPQWHMPAASIQMPGHACGLLPNQTADTTSAGCVHAAGCLQCTVVIIVIIISSYCLLLLLSN
jgi:hypothetical protein